MRIIFTVGLLLFVTNILAQDPDFHIYLCFGQSNMEGHGRFEAQDTIGVNKRFQVLAAVDCPNLGRLKGNWYTALPPLCRCNTGLTPVDYFGRTMVANLPENIRVGVINVSVGGCKIELFDKDNYESYVATAPVWMLNMIREYGGNPYARLVEMAKIAQKDGVIKGILVHQGESNTNDQVWQQKLKTVYDNLLKDLALQPGSVPLLAGELLSAGQNGACASMNSIIGTLQKTIPNAYAISSENCEGISDRLHFSPAGYRLLGKRYAMQMLEILGYSNPAYFKQFTYLGDDQVYKDNVLESGEFYSPILQGCYPDPSITRKGNDFYLVTSSFVMVPGVPIFHSNDLVNWRQIGHVLDRPSQLKVQNAGISAGIYAPMITYNPSNETFYMITTHIAADLGNIIVKTKDPLKGWSDPYKLQFNGIDPSIFFDDDGKAYIVHNDAPDRGKTLYEGHRVIKIWEYDIEKDQVIAGTDKIIIDGGVDISQQPIWIEAPHMYKKNGRYYVMCAEGGTSEWHSEVIFISDHPKGPYIPANNNPILSQRYLSNDRKNKVDWAGHADIVEGNDGKHYGVFLAVRPNDKDRVNTGRETFILPVDWSGGFPVFENGLIPLSPKLKMPKGVTNETGEGDYFPNGNFTFTDNFQSDKLDFRWIGVRGWREEFVRTTKNGLKINPFAVNIKEMKPASILFYRQQHNNFEATTVMDYRPASISELAGLVCYQSEDFNYVLGVTRKDKDNYIVLVRNERQGRGRETQTVSKIIASAKIDLSKPIQLQVKAQGDNYQFNYSVNGNDFKNLGGPVSGDILSTNVAGGFTGSLIGLYVTSSNDIKP